MVVVFSGWIVTITMIDINISEGHVVFDDNYKWLNGREVVSLVVKIDW